VLLALSFPKFGHGAVAWLALVPLLVALPGAPGAQAFRLGYVTGAVSSLGLLYWTALVVTQYGGLSLPVGIAVMVLLCLAFSLFTCVFAWCVARWTEAFGTAALLAAPMGWVATEILRAHTFFRFPWCLLGYSQAGNLPVIQVAAYTAVYGVSFLVAAPSAVLAYVVLEPRTAQRRRAISGLTLTLSLSFGLGLRALSRPLPESGRQRVGLVQASIPQDEKWEAASLFGNMERHAELTRVAAARGARVVVWPESAVPFYYDTTPAIAEPLRALVREENVYLIFGNDDRETSPDGDRVFVGAKMLTPRGDLAFRYHKIRLVPFGEYVPLKPVLTLGGRVAAKLVRQVADFTPGSRYSIGELERGRFATLICYEAIFPDLVREFTARGADVLVNITNDAWYGTTSAPYQHMAMAAFRAVENGKYLVRAANTGITAVVDPRGRVLERTRLFDVSVLVREVPVVSGTTFYARHGDVFAWGCLAAAAALTAATFGVTARRRRPAEGIQ
jgi:apolipoprotein N-acyltransferase